MFTHNVSEYVPHSNRKTGLYSRYFIVPKKDALSHFRSASSEQLRHAAQVQNFNFETNRATDQIRGLVWHDRSQGRILPQIHPSISQEVLEVWHSIITLHFHEIRKCHPGASSSSGYSHNELHRRLVDSSSVASVGSSASRCHSCRHERVGITAKR